MERSSFDDSRLYDRFICGIGHQEDDEMTTDLLRRWVGTLLLWLGTGLLVWQPGTAASNPFADHGRFVAATVLPTDGVLAAGKKRPPNAGKATSPKKKKQGAGKKKKPKKTGSSKNLFKKKNQGAKTAKSKNLNLTEKQAQAELKAVRYKDYAKFNFGKNDLVYGRYKDAHVQKIVQHAGGKSFSSVKLEKHTNIDGRPRLSEPSIKRKSLQVLRSAAKSGRQVHFDLTGTARLRSVMKGKAHKEAITSAELRYIKNNWHNFKTKPKFYRNGKQVDPPW